MATRICHWINVPATSRGYGENRRDLPAFEALVEVQFDAEYIAQVLGQRAARARTRRAVIGSGLVICKVRETR
jgi:hypothetical protein